MRNRRYRRNGRRRKYKGESTKRTNMKNEIEMTGEMKE
jgi:hypothetical protein